MKQFRSTLGGITRIYVELPGRSAVALAGPEEGLTDAQLEERALAYWRAQDREDLICAELRARHNAQVYIGPLPCRDTAWDGAEGRYAYVLKARRRAGYYQVAEAIEL